MYRYSELQSALATGKNACPKIYELQFILCPTFVNPKFHFFWGGGGNYVHYAMLCM